MEAKFNIKIINYEQKRIKCKSKNIDLLHIHPSNKIRRQEHNIQDGPTIKFPPAVHARPGNRRPNSDIDNTFFHL